MDSHGPIRLAGLLIQFGRERQRAATLLVVLGLGLDALIFGSRECDLSGFPIGKGDFLRDFRLQRVRREVLAERLEHLDCSAPLLELQQRGSAVVLRHRAYLRRRRHLGDS